MEKRKLFKKTDLIIVILLLLCALAAVFFLKRGEGARAVVRYKEKELQTISLKKEGVYKVEGDLPVTLEVKDKMIRFIDAQCPDKICQNTGFIHLEDQTAVCMPAKISVTVEGEAWS